MMRPKIYLKLATSLDGKIALKNGQSKWITNATSRAHVQKLRAAAAGILCGIGTVLKDNPNLNLRGDNCPKSQMPISEMPVRIIFDSNLKTPPEFNIVNGAIGGATIIFHDEKISPLNQAKYGDNVTFFGIKRHSDGLDIKCALEILQQYGLENLMLETGGKLAASFLKQGLIDEIYWFFAPKIIGGDGIAVFDNLGFEYLEQAIKLEQISQIELGDDILRHFKVIK